MEAHGVPSRILTPQPLPPRRRQALTSDTFWSLMQRWKVPNDVALGLIGHDAERNGPVRDAKPSFALSDQQAEVVSCLLEIDLTLAITGVREDRLHRRDASSAMAGSSPLDALGRCCPKRAAAVLWFLNQSVQDFRCQSKRKLVPPRVRPADDAMRDARKKQFQAAKDSWLSRW
jgi:hypothetical protein